MPKYAQNFQKSAQILYRSRSTSADPPVRFRRTSRQYMVTKGLVPIEIRWEFHGKSLNDNNSNGISLMLINPKIASLSIDSVNADHAGNYTCIAENAAGTLRHTAELNVIGKNGVQLILLFFV